MRQYLTLPLLALFLSMVAVLGWMFTANSIAMGRQMEQRLTQDLQGRITLYLEQLLTQPVNAVGVAHRLYRAGKLNTGSVADQARIVAGMVATLPELNALNIGLADGRYIGVNRSQTGNEWHTTVIEHGTKPYREVYALSTDLMHDQFVFKDLNAFVPSTRAWYRNASALGKAGWTPAFHYGSSDSTGLSGNFGLGYALPELDVNGHLLGVINSDISLGQIGRYLRSLPLGTGGLVLIVDAENQIIASSGELNPTQGAQLTQLDNSASSLERAAGARLLSRGTGSSDLTHSGTTYIEDAREFKTGNGLALKVLILLPSKQLVEGFHANLGTLVPGLITVLLLGVGMICVLTWRISVPIERLAEWATSPAADAAADGSALPTTLAPDFRVTELRQLSRAFNGFALHLHQTVASLEERVAERTAELELVNSNLFELSNTDGLTGIANRRKLDEVLMNEWNRASRSGQPLAAALIDVDWFKKYNDHYGHLAGDDCLRRVAQILKSKIRRSGDLVARYGGEEFAIIAPGMSRANAIEMANIICSAIAEAQLPHMMTPLGTLTVSVGVAVITPTSDIKPQTLLQATDEALYRAKESGRNRVVCAEIDLVHPRFHSSEFSFEEI